MHKFCACFKYAKPILTLHKILHDICLLLAQSFATPAQFLCLLFLNQFSQDISFLYVLEAKLFLVGLHWSYPFFVLLIYRVLMLLIPLAMISWHLLSYTNIFMFLRHVVYNFWGFLLPILVVDGS